MDLLPIGQPIQKKVYFWGYFGGLESQPGLKEETTNVVLKQLR